MLVLLESWEGSGVCCPLLELDVGVGWVLFFIFYPFVEELVNGNTIYCAIVFIILFAFFLFLSVRTFSFSVATSSDF